MAIGRMHLAMVGLVVTAGVAAGAVQLAAVDSVTPGEWQLKEIDGTETKLMCVVDPGQLLQVQHGTATCARTVIDSSAKVMTVRYTCSSGGNGRTTLTVRSSQSLKLETQGMAGGSPFAIDYDGKRLGDCPGAGATAAPVETVAKPEPKPEAKPKPGGH